MGPASGVVMLTGVGFLIPVILVYNGYMYIVLRGKVGYDQDKDPYTEGE